MPAISASAPDPRAAERVRDADVLLVIGDRLGEIDDRRLHAARRAAPAQTLIHVHPDPDELGRVYQPDARRSIALAGAFALALAALRRRSTRARWAERPAQAHADYLDNLQHGPAARRRSTWAR